MYIKKLSIILNLTTNLFKTIVADNNITTIETITIVILFF